MTGVVSADHLLALTSDNVRHFNGGGELAEWVGVRHGAFWWRVRRSIQQMFEDL